MPDTCAYIRMSIRVVPMKRTDIRVNNIFVVNVEEMRPLDRPRHRRENETETDVRDIVNGKASSRSEQSLNVQNATGTRDNNIYVHIKCE